MRETIKRRKPFQYRRFFGGQVEDGVLTATTSNVGYRWTWPMSVFGHPYVPKAFMRGYIKRHIKVGE